MNADACSEEISVHGPSGFLLVGNITGGFLVVLSLSIMNNLYPRWSLGQNGIC